MRKEAHIQFCGKCGKEMPYHLRNAEIAKAVGGKEYLFEIASAFCDGCGEPVSPPGLFDRNAEGIDRQYREKERIASVETIRKLMARYRMGKESLSLAFGLHAEAAGRYLAGQIPASEVSDMFRKALASPAYMMAALQKNREKMDKAAYRDAMRAGEELECFFALSGKLRAAIIYLLQKGKSITPLSLQKMLYYAQGICLALSGRELFREDCQAWAHGPVYKNVYEAFRSFGREPIDGTRFYIGREDCPGPGELSGREEDCSGPGELSGKEKDCPGPGELSEREKKVLDLVAESLGSYSGKTLEKVTHEETPWREARKGCKPSQRSSAVITKASVRTYFAATASRYHFTSAAGIRAYIEDKSGIYRR